MNKALSILILTIEGREDTYTELMTCLAKQVKTFNLQDKVQISTFKDKPNENNKGFKRNELLQNCVGEWAMFVDDDDLLSETALPDIIYRLETFNPDVVSLIGIITTNGNDPREFHHSLKYKVYDEINGIYVRPPNHLNAIRTKISKKYKFPEINHGEDTAWAMEICNSGLLKTEAEYNKPYYYYRFNPSK